MVFYYKNKKNLIVFSALFLSLAFSLTSNIVSAETSVRHSNLLITQTSHPIEKIYKTENSTAGNLKQRVQKAKEERAEGKVEKTAEKIAEKKLKKRERLTRFREQRVEKVKAYDRQKQHQAFGRHL